MPRINWKGIRLISIIVFFVFGGYAFSVQTNKTPLFEQMSSDLHTLPETVIEDFKLTFSREDNIFALLLSGGASAAMHNGTADVKISESVESNQILEGTADESLNIIGCPGTHFAIAGLWYALAHEKGDTLNKNRAWTTIRALSVTGLGTIGLKAMRHNDSPNGKSWAWPSGHTSSSVAFASVLDEFYGPKVGIPAYCAAGLVAYRMMETGDHWASDVVFGATLGWVAGHTIAGSGKMPEIGGFTVLPLTSNEPAAGVSLFKRF
jgi:membrane-associated phospholipid phosphatase